LREIVVRNCGFSETFFFVVCDDIWIAIYPSFVVVSIVATLQWKVHVHAARNRAQILEGDIYHFYGNMCSF